MVDILVAGEFHIVQSLYGLSKRVVDCGGNADLGMGGGVEKPYESHCLVALVGFGQEGHAVKDNPDG